MFRVERLAARVTLDDPASSLAQAEQAAAAGDESWQRWVEEYRSGSALIVRLETTLEAADGDGEPLVIQIANRGVFLEKAHEPPKVEQQVGELVAKDFPALARALERHGHRIDQHVLGQMYVHVELAADVRSALDDAEAAIDESGLPEFDASLSELEGPHERSGGAAP